MKRVFLKIASLFYGAAIKLRHLLFDINILHSERFDIPIICVGNITVGEDVLIAPNAYVNVNVPSHSIVMGNPAVIHSRENATEGYINRSI